SDLETEQRRERRVTEGRREAGSSGWSGALRSLRCLRCSVPEIRCLRPLRSLRLRGKVRPMRRILRTAVLLSSVVATFAAVGPASRAAPEHRFLYVAEPGIRNYVEYGGVGVLVYDIDAGYTFVRRIASQAVPAGQEPENVKGIAASAATGRLYVTT